MKRCSQWRTDRQYIYTKELTKTTDLEKIVGKLPTWAVFPFMLLSRDMDSLFWDSYLVGRTRYTFVPVFCKKKTDK